VRGRRVLGPPPTPVGHDSGERVEVSDADALANLEEKGVLSRKIGCQFRERILSRGDRRIRLTRFEGFTGRRAESDALPGRSAIRDPRSAIRDPRSAIRDPRSAIRDPRSAIRDPRSAIRDPG
jgi:hypothetical protein